MTNEQLSYIAGIFDGEGSVGLYCNNPSKTDRHSIVLRVNVGNTSKALIDWLLSTTNIGSVRLKEVESKTRRQAYVWSVCSRQAVEFLRQIRPWLVVKAAQVDVVISLAERESAEGIKPGKKPSAELQRFRQEAAQQVKALKLVA